MKTKREVLEQVAKCGNCEGIKCTDCPYYKSGKHCINDDFIKRIGAMAILRQNRKKRKFDPNKVLTCVTANQAKVGMKGYFGDSLSFLKIMFKRHKISELIEISDETNWCRFRSSDDILYALFYPIDEVEE